MTKVFHNLFLSRWRFLSKIYVENHHYTLCPGLGVSWLFFSLSIGLPWLPVAFVEHVNVTIYARQANASTVPGGSWGSACKWPWIFHVLHDAWFVSRCVGSGLAEGILEKRLGWDNGHSINAKRWTSTLWLIMFARLWTGIAEKFIGKFDFLRPRSVYRLPFITRRSVLIDLRPLDAFRGAISLATDFLPLRSENCCVFWMKHCFHFA